MSHELRRSILASVVAVILRYTRCGPLRRRPHLSERVCAGHTQTDSSSLSRPLSRNSCCSWSPWISPSTSSNFSCKPIVLHVRSCILKRSSSALALVSERSAQSGSIWLSSSPVCSDLNSENKLSCEHCRESRELDKVASLSEYTSRVLSTLHRSASTRYR
jgi:hypothetical protein